MRRFLLFVTLAVAAMGLAGTVASAHECTDASDPSTCRETPVYPNWRGSRVPFFGLDDREDARQRQEAQRWRDEYGCRQQFCVWADFSNSVQGGTPNEVHAGAAGDHSFLAEAAHQSEDHGTEEGNHDSHGGAIYADVCLAESHDTSYAGQPGECDEGPEDTQAGVTVMDHNPCPACEDNYLLVRPFDWDCDDPGQPAHRRYCTQRTLENGAAATTYHADHPGEWFCGYRAPGGDPDNQLCPDEAYTLDGSVLP